MTKIVGLDNMLMVSNSTKQSSLVVSPDNLEGTIQSRSRLGVNSIRVRQSAVVAFPTENVGGSTIFTYNLTFDFSNIVQNGIVLPKPLVTVYIDTDDDSDFIWPDGASVSSIPITIDTNMDVRDVANPAKNIHKLTITIQNFDGSAHDVYPYVGFLFIP